MPNCYMCKKETPVTQFYLLKMYKDEESAIWYYACGVPCLKKLVRDKAIEGSKFLIREYMTTCGKAWSFKSRGELEWFVGQLR